MNRINGVFMPKASSILSIAVPSLFLGGFVSAEIVQPGGMTTTDFATTLANRPDLGGSLEAMQDIPFSLTDDQGKVFYIGQIQHEVMRDPDTNTLSFYYKFINAPSSSVLGVEDLVAGSFKDYSTDVAILTDTAGDTAPTDVLRNTTGSNVIFEFDAASSRIAPGNSSFTFLVKTNATQFDNKGTASITAFIADSTDEGSQLLAGGEATINTFRPTGTPIPIASPPAVAVSAPLPPAAWSALPTMFASAMYVRRWRKRQGHG